MRVLLVTALFLMGCGKGGSAKPEATDLYRSWTTTGVLDRNDCAASNVSLTISSDKLTLAFDEGCDPVRVACECTYTSTGSATDMSVTGVACTQTGTSTQSCAPFESYYQTFAIEGGKLRINSDTKLWTPL